MILSTLISKVQEEKPNTFPDEKLVEYINEIEAEVAEQMHIDDVPVYVPTDLSPELIAPAPYDRLYVSYLKAMIDYANEEYASYQLNQEQHTLDFQDFVNYVVREKQARYKLYPTRLRTVM